MFDTIEQAQLLFASSLESLRSSAFKPCGSAAELYAFYEHQYLPRRKYAMSLNSHSHFFVWLTRLFCFSTSKACLNSLSVKHTLTEFLGVIAQYVIYLPRSSKHFSGEEPFVETQFCADKHTSCVRAFSADQYKEASK